MAKLKPNSEVGGQKIASEPYVDAKINDSVVSSNTTWSSSKINSQLEAANTTVQGSDYAELFSNLEGQEIPAGTLLTLDGDGVRIAQEGDEILGTVSYTHGILGNETSFCWQGRYLKDEFGRYITETIWDEDVGEYIEFRKENPEYNPDLPHTPRSERPDEWTPVGLLGQVFVRVKEDVQPGDWLKADNGIGVKSEEKTNVKVMKITSERVVKCLVK